MSETAVIETEPEFVPPVGALDDSDTSTPPKPNGEQPAVNLSPERGQRKRAAPQPATPRSGMARAGVRRDKAPKSDEQRHREGIADIQRARGQGQR